MSSPRVQKIFQAMPNQLRRLGKYDIDFTEVLRWSGRVTATADGHQGRDAAVIDLTSGDPWATLNKRLIIVAEPASDLQNTPAMKTQSHASGHYIDGSVRFHVYMEASAAFAQPSTDAIKEYWRFISNVQTHLVGQLAAPTKFWFSDVTDEPHLDSVNGAGSSADFTETEWLLPYGMVYPGGV